MKEERIYKPYHQYISEAEKLDDDTFFALIQEIEKICCMRIDISKWIKAHNAIWEEYETQIEDTNTNPEIINGKKRLDALIELCSLVNKVTKIEKENRKKNIETGPITDKITKIEKGKKIEAPVTDKTDSEAEISFTVDEKRKIRRWERTEKREKYSKIIDGLKSDYPDVRKEAAENFAKLSDAEFSEYKQYKEAVEDEKYFYKLKQEILTAIIYELRTHPEEYSGYQYGFMEDDVEKVDTSCVFAINIPGHLGTYQFHIPRKQEKDILYTVDDIYDVNHRFSGMAAGDKDISKMKWIYTSDDIKNFEKIEQQYEEIKKNLSISLDIEDDDYRRLYMLAILLKKDPEQELIKLSERAAKYYINSSKSFTENRGKRSRRIVEQYEGIIRNIKTNGKIYVASGSSIDSKVAIEAIVRQAKLEGFEGNVEIIEVEPGKQDLDGGVFINVKKDGIKTDKKNQNGMLFINANDSDREQSVCSVLSKLGFDVPKNIVKYASKVMPEIYKDPNNAYLLLGKMDGKTIFNFCKEIEDRGEDLIEISLIEEKIESYSSFSDENKEALITDSKKKTKIFEEIKANIEYQHIGDKKVAIYNGGLSRATYAMYISFAEGADYYISCNENEEKGIQCCAMSNPRKCDLPLEVERWAYKKTLEEGILEDVLIEKTRVIIGGRTKPNIFLTDRRDNKSKKYTEEIKEQIISEIQKTEGINYANQIVKKSLEEGTNLQGLKATERDMINTQEKKEKDGGERGIE